MPARLCVAAAAAARLFIHRNQLNSRRKHDISLYWDCGTCAKFHVKFTDLGLRSSRRFRWSCYNVNKLNVRNNLTKGRIAVLSPLSRRQLDSSSLDPMHLWFDMSQPPPSGILIGSAVFAELTRARPTHRHTQTTLRATSVVSGRIFCVQAMRPNNTGWRKKRVISHHESKCCSRYSQCWPIFKILSLRDSCPVRQTAIRPNSLVDFSAI